MHLESGGRGSLRERGGNVARVGFENWHVRISRHLFHLTIENLRLEKYGIVFSLLVILRESPDFFVSFLFGNCIAGKSI